MLTGAKIEHGGTLPLSRVGVVATSAYLRRAHLTLIENIFYFPLPGHFTDVEFRVDRKHSFSLVSR